MGNISSADNYNIVGSGSTLPQKIVPIKLFLYLLPKFSTVPFTIVLISGISAMVNDTVLNFDKRYEDD